MKFLLTTISFGLYGYTLGVFGIVSTKFWIMVALGLIIYLVGHLEDKV